MYKRYPKNGYDVMYFRFDSLTEYLAYLNETPIQRVFSSNPYSVSGEYSFTNTRSFEEAVQLCKFGYHDNFEKLVELKIKLEKFVKLASNKTRQFNDYIGYVPDVKAFLEGSPLSMLNKVNPLRRKIDIYLNTSYYGGTSYPAIFNRGAITLSVVEILEKLGYSVDLHLFEMSTVGRELHFSEFILKTENERVNMQKLYFPLCHPSWIRRLNFRLIETTPNISSDWTSGYGKPSDFETIKKIITLRNNDILLPTIDELGVEGQDIIEDTNDVFDYINNSSNKDFTLERIKTLELKRSKSYNNDDDDLPF